MGDQEVKLAAWLTNEHAVSGVKDWVLCIANGQCGEAGGVEKLAEPVREEWRSRRGRGT